MSARCPSDGYPTVVSKEINPPVAQFPRCLNPTHPVRPACPSCGSTAVHTLTIGGLLCRECRHAWSRDDAIRASGSAS